MPTVRNQLFKCVKCGYKQEKLIGDVVKSIDDLVPKCPKCGNPMKSANFLDKILYKFKQSRNFKKF